MMKHLHSALLATVFTGTAAFAQELPGGATALSESHGSWIVSCQTVETKANCAITQNQQNQQNGQRILTVELGATAGAETVQGVMILPFGLRLADGITLSIDEETETTALAFSTCLPAGCVVPVTLEPALIAKLQAGKSATLLARANATGQDVVISVPLDGFAAALARQKALTGG